MPKTPSPRLRALAEGSLLRQTLLLRGTAVAGVLLGLILGGAALFARGTMPQRLVALAFAGAFTLGSGGLYAWLTVRAARTRRLLYELPATIQKVQLIEFRGRGLRTWSVMLTDADGTQLGLPMGNADDAQALAAEVEAARRG